MRNNKGQPEHDDGQETNRKGRSKESAEDLREANENIRKAQGDDAMDTTSSGRRSGNKPAFDRDR
jgi:hypothetical protein